MSEYQWHKQHGICVDCNQENALPKGTAFDTMIVECMECGAAPYAVSVYENDTEQAKREAVAKFWNRREERLH